MLEAKDHHSGRHGRDDYNQSSQLATCLPCNSTIDVCFKLDSLWGYLECPRTNHGDRKPDDSEQDDQPDDPVWNIEEGKDLCCDLDEQPGYYEVGHCDAVNTAPFQFSKKSAHSHRRAADITVPIPETISDRRSWRALGNADRRGANRTSDRAGGVQA